MVSAMTVKRKQNFAGRRECNFIKTGELARVETDKFNNSKMSQKAEYFSFSTIAFSIKSDSNSRRF
jgi:hypothetical protein